MPAAKTQDAASLWPIAIAASLPLVLTAVRLAGWWPCDVACQGGGFYQRVLGIDVLWAALLGYGLLAALGPQQLALADGTLRGHTFHYSTCATSLTAAYRTARPDLEPSPQAGEAVYCKGSIRASYFHAWFESSPAATAALFCRATPGSVA